MTEKNNDNRSLIWYTSLIFIVAIVVIVFGKFGGDNLAQKQYSEEISEVKQEHVTLSNKAAQVSEENMQLIEFNKNLRHNNQVLLDEKNTLTTERDALVKENTGYKALIAVYDKLSGGKKNEARKMLEGIYTEDLTNEQKEFYDTLVKKTQ